MNREARIDQLLAKQTGDEYFNRELAERNAMEASRTARRSYASEPTSEQLVRLAQTRNLVKKILGGTR